MMNKKFLLPYLFCFVLQTVQAQDSQLEYRLFAQDGKEWSAQIGGIKENVYNSFIDGDTVISGETWKKVYNYIFMPIFGTSYYCAIRDVDKKVYAITKGSNRPRQLYDFGLKVGDMVRCGIEGNSFGCLLERNETPDTLLGFPFIAYLKVERIDTITARGLQHRRFTLTLLDSFRQHFLSGEEGRVIENVVWVEGVGSGAGPFSPWLPLPPKYSFLQACDINRTCIFGFPDFYMNKTGKSRADLNDDGIVDVADIAKVIDSMAGQTGK